MNKYIKNTRTLYKEMILDIAANIFDSCDTPKEFGKVVCKEMKKLTGAKIAALYEYSPLKRMINHKFYLRHVDPFEKKNIIDIPEAHTFLIHQINSRIVSIFKQNDDQVVSHFLKRLNMSNSLLIPLYTKSYLEGFLILYDFHMNEELIDILKDLNLIIHPISQVLRNSKMFYNLEEIIQNRTQELIDKEENLKITLNAINEAVIATDTKGFIVRMNPVAEKLTGWTGALGHHLEDILKQKKSDQSLYSSVDLVSEVLLKNNTVFFNDFQTLKSLNGREYSVEINGSPIKNKNSETVGVVFVFRDMTSQKQLEEQLRQSQKMESLGQLAGGIAHDFNNMLGGIIGTADLIDLYCNDNEKIREFVQIILDVTDKAKDLTQKLLTFSRKEQMITAPIDIHSIINSTISLLKRSIHPNIVISKQLEASNCTMMGDASQIQNAILNLALNAKDAMQNGGRILIQTKNFIYNLDEKNREFIEIRVKDSGCGIDPDIMERIFEPFFTTKKPGEGTGLGLSGVYGTISSHKGHINVYSEPGIGSEFKIHLPVEQLAVNQKQESLELIKGTGTVLIIDDEPIIRNILDKMLKEIGYNVHVAKDGQEGIQTFKDNISDINLVILDMIMPEMNGPDTFKELRQIQPQVPVIIASGFSENQKINELIQQGAKDFILKPFRQTHLSQKIHEILSKN